MFDRRILWVMLVVFAPGGALAENRTYNGLGNNIAHPSFGAAGTSLLRVSGAAYYTDGISSPAGATRPSPRLISNVIVAQTSFQPNALGLSDWVFQWGQFIDHELDLTDLAEPAEPFNIVIPPGDPVFTGIMPFSRSKYDVTTGTSPGNPRQQINELTSFIDGSMVYGSSETRALALRSMNGGRLLTSAHNLLPHNTMGLPNATGGAPDPTQFFVAGDVRVNEQVGLTAVHTLLMREHNRLADQLAAQNPGWDDEMIFQRARKIVGAEIQSITFHEFLPAILGPNAPGLDSIYDDQVDPGVATEFSAALYRVGHTMLSPQLLRIQNDGTAAPGGAVALRDAFFQPNNIANGEELEYLLKGLASQQQQEFDNHIVDDVRNFLFGEPTPGAGFDLAALNIQRGRDHGLPDYNSMREAFGLSRVDSFDDISSKIDIQTKLSSLYGSVDNIDPWVGALAEDHLPGAYVGELIAAGLIDQFVRAKDCDRFWFRNDPDFTADQIAAIDATTLSDLIRWNTNITNLQSNVFYVPEAATCTLAIFVIAWAGLHSRAGGGIRREFTD